MTHAAVVRWRGSSISQGRRGSGGRGSSRDGGSRLSGARGSDGSSGSGSGSGSGAGSGRGRGREDVGHDEDGGGADGAGSARVFAEKEAVRSLEEGCSDGGALWGPLRDPVSGLALVSLWPEFAEGSEIDNEVCTTLTAGDAPTWRLRIHPPMRVPGDGGGGGGGSGSGSGGGGGGHAHGGGGGGVLGAQTPMAASLQALLEARSKARALGMLSMVTEIVPPPKKALVEDYDNVPAARGVAAVGAVIGSLMQGAATATEWRDVPEEDHIQGLIDRLFDYDADIDGDGTGMAGAAVVDGSGGMRQHGEDADTQHHARTFSPPPSASSPWLPFSPSAPLVPGTAPVGSLLSLVACHMGHLGSLEAMATLWTAFVKELRWHFEQRVVIPKLGATADTGGLGGGGGGGGSGGSGGGGEAGAGAGGVGGSGSGAPMVNYRACVLHQKLTLLNYCITCQMAGQAEDNRSEKRGGNGGAGGAGKPGRGGRRGDEEGGGVRRLRCGVRFVEPTTTDVAYSTDDMLEERRIIVEAVLSRDEEDREEDDRGGRSGAANVTTAAAAPRRRPPSTKVNGLLRSDMAAFKASNREGVYADFCEWYIRRLDAVDRAVPLSGTNSGSCNRSSGGSGGSGGRGGGGSSSRPPPPHPDRMRVIQDFNLRQGASSRGTGEGGDGGEDRGGDGGEDGARYSGYELWLGVEAMAVEHQRPVLDTCVEGEKILHYFETLAPSYLFDELFAVGMVNALHLLRHADTRATELPVVEKAMGRLERDVAAAATHQSSIAAAADAAAADAAAADAAASSSSSSLAGHVVCMSVAQAEWYVRHHMHRRSPFSFVRCSEY